MENQQHWVIAIDPGTNETGIAMGDVYSDTPFIVELIKPKKEDYMQRLFDMAAAFQPKTAYLERTWHGVNPKTTITLASLGGNYEAALHLGGKTDTKFIAPATWQSVMIPEFRRQKHKLVKQPTKVFSKALALKLAPGAKRIKNNNIADAVCIWFYAKMEITGWKISE